MHDAAMQHDQPETRLPAAQAAAQDFIESMGLSAEADGLPRIAGRMWGYFIVRDGPFSLAELAESLQVSRGSISTNARILRDLGVLERISRPGDRQDYYQLADRPYDRLLLGYVERMRRTASHAARAQQSLPSSWQGAQNRLAEMRRFHHAAVVTTEKLIQQLREHPETLPPSDDASGNP